MATSSVYLLFLWILPSVLAQSASEEVVSCRLGKTCVLPCPSQGQLLEVHWRRSPENYNVHVFFNNRDQPRSQHPLYTSRTSLSRGDASLRLSQVTLKDQGSFRCYTISSQEGTSGDQSHYLQLTVFAPVLEVSLEQEGQQLLCRSEGIYPEPDVFWSPSVDHNTTVTESERGLFSVVSSVPLSDSEDQYICNVSAAHSWRRAVLKVEDLVIILNEWSPHQEGFFSCLSSTDTESVIRRVQVKRPNFALIVTAYIIPFLLLFALLFYIFYRRCKDQKRIKNLEQHRKETEDLLQLLLPNEANDQQNPELDDLIMELIIMSNHQESTEAKNTPAAPPEPQQDRPPDGQDGDEDCAPDDPHESPAAVRHSPDTVHVEIHSSLEINENNEANDQQNPEQQELMSNHRESTEVKMMQVSGHDDSRGSTDVQLQETVNRTNKD